MNFRYKCALQWIFSYLPYPSEWNYFAQRYLSRKFPASDLGMNTKYERAVGILEKFKKYSEKPLSEAVFFEFGAGWDLYLPMILSTFGVGKIYSTDLTPLSKQFILNDSFRHVKRLAGKNQTVPSSVPLFTKKNFRTILQKYFRIEYEAPVDARNINRPDNSIDLIFTNSVIQNIPPFILTDIVKDCYRILSSGGLVSFRQSYADQWSYVDKSISRYNYLRYSEKEWKKYCPPLQYQNRLRHKDYVKMYTDAGFEIIEENLELPNKLEQEILKQLPISKEFLDKYTMDELIINGSWCILRKNVL
jgi:SAM-dependent methyltransferase